MSSPPACSPMPATCSAASGSTCWNCRSCRAPAASAGCGRSGPTRRGSRSATGCSCDPTVRSRDDAVSPDIILQGLTAGSEAALRLQRYYHDGAFAEQVRVPTENASRSAPSTRPTPAAGARSARCSFPMAACWPAGCWQARPCWSTAPPAPSAAPVWRSVSRWARARVVATGPQREGAGRPRAALRRPRPDGEDDRQRGGGPPPDAAGGRRRRSTACSTSCRRWRAASWVRAAVLAVRPYGRAVLMGGIRDDVALPYAWMMRELHRGPRPVDVSARRDPAPGRADPLGPDPAGGVRGDRIPPGPRSTRRWPTPPPIPAPSR